MWDSTSECGSGLADAPEGHEGWSEEELATLVTRNAMRGVGGEIARISRVMNSA